jgi:NADH-quinone oxidoreductase subunit J
MSLANKNPKAQKVPKMFWFSLIMSIVALGFAAGVVFSKEAVHSALCLTANLLCIAVIYVTMSLHFLAAAQLLIYAGAIMVVFLFAVTVLAPEEELFADHKDGAKWLGMLVGMALGGGLLAAGMSAQISDDTTQAVPGHLRDFAQLLFGRFVLPFECTAFVLMVGLIAAALLSHKRLKVRPPQSVEPGGKH